MIDLRQGDSLEILKSIPDKSIDLIVTDPPYKFDSALGGGAFGNGHKHYHDELKSDALIDGISNVFLDECMRIMKKVNIYIWCNKNQILQYLQYFEKYNMELLTWHKTNPVPACCNKYLSDTEYCLFFREKGVHVYGTYSTKHKYYVTPSNVDDKKKYGHPTIKPLNIITNLIINSSSEGDTVLDCFMGSGTTGVACKELNRNFIGIELLDKYFQIAKNRIEGFSPDTLSLEMTDDDLRENPLDYFF